MDETIEVDVSKVKSKREQRAMERNNMILAQNRKLENMNITSIAEQELANDLGMRSQSYEHDNDEDAQDSGVLVKCLQLIFSAFRPPPKPLLPWKTTRREEINGELDKTMNSVWGILLPSRMFWYWMISNRRMKYIGDFALDNKKVRDGRGVCIWPDPSIGGGGSSNFPNSFKIRFLLRAS